MLLFEKQYYSKEDAITDLSFVTTTLNGLGIRYLKNMDYLGQYVKSQMVYTFNDTTQQYDLYEATAQLDFDGNASSVEGNEELYEQLRQYSLDYMLYEQGPDWLYMKDEHDRITMRVKKRLDYTTLKAWFAYVPGTRLIAEVKTKQYPSRQKERITFTYDDERRLMEKTVEQEGQSLFKEVFAYDERCLLTSSTFLRLENGTAYPFAIIQSEYHSPEEVIETLTGQ